MPKRTGKFSRQKGQRYQYRVRDFLTKLGVRAEIVARSGYTGPDVAIWGASGTRYLCEVKARGFDQKTKEPNRFPNVMRILETQPDVDLAVFVRTGQEPTFHGRLLILNDIFKAVNKA